MVRVTQGQRALVEVFTTYGALHHDLDPGRPLRTTQLEEHHAATHAAAADAAGNFQWLLLWRCRLRTCPFLGSDRGFSVRFQSASHAYYIPTS